MSKRVCSIILCLSMLIIIAGCGGLYSESDSTSWQVHQNILENPYDDEDWNMVVYQDATILTMAAWAPSATLQIIIDEFNESHTDYQIQLKIYYEPQADDDAVYAAIDRMTVDLMTGGAPDLFSLNSMDVMALKNAGLLMDLYPMMEQDESFDLNDFYTNVWETFEMNGCLYELLPTFYLSGIMAPAAVVGDQAGWTYEEWLELCQTEEYLLNVDQTEMLSYMILYSAGEFVDIEDSTCSFDSESFLNWLAVIQSAPKQKDLSSDTAYETATFVSGISEYAASITSKGTGIAYCGFPSSDAQGPVAIAMDSYGISSTTAYPEVCWEFLKYFLESDVYERLGGNGFPARKSVLEQQLNRAQLQLDDTSSLFYGWPAAEITPLSTDQADYLRCMIESMDHCAFRYDSIEDIIREDVAAYLAGDKSAEEVARIIQNRAGIYLSEQS